MSFRVLVTSIPMLSTIEACQERFAAEHLDIVAPTITQQYTETELCTMIGDFDGVIAGDDPFTAKVLEIGRQGRLRALVRLGIGIDWGVINWTCSIISLARLSRCRARQPIKPTSILPKILSVPFFNLKRESWGVACGVLPCPQKAKSIERQSLAVGGK